MATKRKKSEEVDQSVCCVAVGGITPQRGSASRPRVLRGKRGGLKDMLNMPVDIGFEICSHLDPLDLLQLSRTSKALRTLLMSRTSRFLWRSARSHIDGLPDCPPYLSEPAYANLVFSAQCHNCTKKNAKVVLWKFAVRYCKSCKNIMTISGSYKKWCEKEFTEVWNRRELLNSIKRSCQTPLYHIPQIEQLMHTLEGNKNALKQFEEEQIARVEAFDKHAEQCEAWEKEKSTAREIAMGEIRDQRTDEIHERLEELDLGQLSPKLWRLPRELVHKPKLLTERDWEKILDKLLMINSREAVFLPIGIFNAACPGNTSSYIHNSGNAEDINSVHAQPFGYVEASTGSGTLTGNGGYLTHSEENGTYGEDALYTEHSFQAEDTPQIGYFDYANQFADNVQMRQDNPDYYIHNPPCAMSSGASYTVGIQDSLTLPSPIGISGTLHTLLCLFSSRYAGIRWTAASGYTPHFADIALMPAFEEMVYRYGDGGMTIKEIEDGLPDVIKMWGRQVARELRALMMAAIGTADLELAVAFFECTSCKMLLTHYDAVAHPCMRLPRPSHGLSRPGSYEDEIYHLTGQCAWTSEELKTAAIIPKIRDIIRMCGKDPDYTVRLRMDIAHTRLCCHPPDDPEHKLTVTWRGAIEMEHARISGVTESIEPLSWRAAYQHEEQLARDEEASILDKLHTFFDNHAPE